MKLTQSEKMEITRDFYAVLPSNASMTEHPNNKPQSYKTKLSNPMRLAGEWEVGLAEIQFPNNWFNVTEPWCFMLHFVPPMLRAELDQDQVISGYGPRYVRVNVTVPAGEYKNIQELCGFINRLIKEAVERERIVPPSWVSKHAPVSFEYSKVSKIVTITSTAQWAFILFMEGNQMPRILGFDPVTLRGEEVDDTIKFPLPLVGTEEAFLKGHYPALFVYSSCVQQQIVGDTLAPLLRTIPVAGTGAIKFRLFEKAIYMPAVNGYINEIEIRVCDDSGVEIPFLSGKVICTLHFRKCL